MEGGRASHARTRARTNARTPTRTHARSVVVLAPAHEERRHLRARRHAPLHRRQRRQRAPPHGRRPFLLVMVVVIVCRFLWSWERKEKGRGLRSLGASKCKNEEATNRRRERENGLTWCSRRMLCWVWRWGGEEKGGERQLTGRRRAIDPKRHAPQPTYIPAPDAAPAQGVPGRPSCCC